MSLERLGASFDAVPALHLYIQFPSLGTKKEGLVYLRFSFGKGLPEARSLSTARINHDCTWNTEEPSQIVVTKELAKLTGAEIRLHIDAFSETAGAKVKDKHLYPSYVVSFSSI